MSQNAVKIGRLIIPIVSLEEAVAIWEQIRNERDLGASESPKVTACFDKKLFRISYNGRVWDAGTGAEVIIDKDLAGPVGDFAKASRERIARREKSEISRGFDAYQRRLRTAIALEGGQS